MASIRISLLSTSYPLSGNEISGIFVSKLIRFFPQDSFVSIITPATPRSQPDSGGSYNILPFRYAPNNWQILAHSPGGIPVALKRNKLLYCLLPSFLISMLFACYRSARGSDLIHANWVVCGCIGGIVGKLLRRPVITTLRGDDITRAKKFLIDRLMLIICLRLSTYTVTVSTDMEDWILAKYPLFRKKVRFLANGVDDSFFKAGNDRERRSSDDIVTLVTVGSLIPRKGMALILSALDKIKNDYKVILKIIGSGPEEEKLRNIVTSLSLDNSVQFLGVKNPAEVPHFLASSDIFILASYSEGRPNAVLEAMAAAMPIVASKINGVTEIIKNNENGMLFEPGNSGQLAACIASLCSDPARCENLGRAAREFIVNNRLLWSETSQQYFRLYQDALVINKQKFLAKR